MKKLISAILVLIMVFCLCACGQSVPVSTNTNTSTSENVSVTSEELVAGLICLHDTNSTYDANFIDAFNAACEATGVTPMIKYNIGEDDTAYTAAAELADAGCGIVFADSFGHEPYIVEAAQEFPEVEFCHATGVTAHTAGLSNFHNAFAAIYEGRYLDGVALGMKLDEMGYEAPQVGYVSAHNYAECISGYTSFFLGVRSICPDATMLVNYTDSWFDQTLEAESANALAKLGCVGISSHADSTGVPSTCEQLGVPFVFYNGSVKEISPNTYIVSTRINWQPYFEYAINCKLNGEAIATDWTGTVETGSVVMTEVNTTIAAEGTEEVLNDVIEMMKSGDLHVFDTSTFTVDGKELTEFDVEGTNVVSDGYFHESEIMSAPYFAFIIDGVTEVGG